MKIADAGEDLVRLLANRTDTPPLGWDNPEPAPASEPAAMPKP